MRILLGSLIIYVTLSLAGAAVLREVSYDGGVDLDWVGALLASFTLFGCICLFVAGLVVGFSVLLG